MLQWRIVTLFSLFLVLFGGVTSIRNVKLVVEPPVVIRGGTVALFCNRDMQDAPLYSVKWYRGNHEFFRYTPQEVPDTREFTIRGIYVDTLRSNGSCVLLRHMDLSMAGNYSCEVTADSPSFATQFDFKYVDVVAPPVLGPVLNTDKDRYQPGEFLRANCTSAPARPPANLTIKINEEPTRSSETSFHPSENGYLWASISAELKVTPQLFVGGRMRVACEATIYNVYNSSANLDFLTPETDPRPERITFSSAAKCFQRWILLLVMFLLPMVVISQDLDNYEVLDFGNSGTDFYDEACDDHAILSLVGG